MRRILVTLVGIVLSVIMAVGENYNFVAQGPQVVALGATFHVTYVINANGTSFEEPTIPDFFEVKYGPARSFSSSKSWVNGKSTSSVETANTYTLRATTEGIFTIPAASIVAEGVKYRSNPLTIKVVKDNTNIQTTAGAIGRDNDATEGNRGGIQNIGGVNVLLRSLVSKTSMYEQEAFLLTYKLYYTGVQGIRINDAVFPDFKGFYVQELDLPEEKQAQEETFNGRLYKSAVLKQYLLLPQQSGNIVIPKAEVQTILRVSVANRKSVFDEFFGNVAEVGKKVESSPVTIAVKPLPSPKPKNFSGGVGQFSLSTDLSSDQLTENEALTIKLKIKGNGNLKLLKDPNIEFPSDFEAYNPQSITDVRNTINGILGSRNVEYVAIARHVGDYQIPSSEFVYFDPKAATYKTLLIPTQKIRVDKGQGVITGVNNSVVINDKETVEMLDEDIRFIDTQSVRLSAKNNFFYGSTSYILSFLGLILLAVSGFGYWYYQRYIHSNSAIFRSQVAAKKASKRLKKVEQYINKGNDGKIHEEILKTFWGYFSDKFGDAAMVNKECLSEKLLEVGLSHAIVERVEKLISNCETFRYAPAIEKIDDRVLYNEALTLLSEVDSELKTKMEE